MSFLPYSNLVYLHVHWEGVCVCIFTCVEICHRLCFYFFFILYFEQFIAGLNCFKYHLPFVSLSLYGLLKGVWSPKVHSSSLKTGEVDGNHIQLCFHSTAIVGFVSNYFNLKLCLNLNIFLSSGMNCISFS